MPDVVDHDMRHAWTALFVVGLTSFQSAAGLSMLFVVYPDLAASFPEASAAQLSWVLTAFTITGAATLVLGGAAGERYGRRRALTAGTLLFTAGSVLGALAPAVPVLVVARAIQAVGAALSLPNGATIVLDAFPVTQRASAVAMWGAIGGAAAAIGPSLGGLLVTIGSWRWAFWFNVPVAAIAIGAQLLLPDDRPAGRPPLPDIGGVPLLLGGVGLSVLGLVQSDDWGWGDRRTLASFAVGAVLITLLTLRCRTHPRPVIAPGLAHNRSFVWANLAMLLAAAGFFGFQYTAIQLLTGVWGHSISDTGLLMTPLFALTGIATLVTGRWGMPLGHTRLVVVGGAMLTLGIGSLAFLGADRDPTYWLVASVPIGLGSGAVWGVLLGVMVQHLEPGELSGGASVNQTLQRVANAVGVAVSVTVLGDVVAAEWGATGTTFVAQAALSGLATIAGLLGCRSSGRLRRAPEVVAVPVGQAGAQWTSVR